MGKRSRTIYFGDFADNADGGKIESVITTRTHDAKDDIEEIYPIGRVGERGGARFKSEQGMWDYIQKHQGKLVSTWRAKKCLQGWTRCMMRTPPGQEL